MALRDHSLDDKITAAAMEEFSGKLLVQQEPDASSQALSNLF